jgi:hypothetical protein
VKRDRDTANNAAPGGHRTLHTGCMTKKEHVPLFFPSLGLLAAVVGLGAFLGPMGSDPAIKIGLFNALCLLGGPRLDAQLPYQT